MQTWDEIPDELKEPTGLFVGDYGGYMSIGYDSSKFDAPSELADLLSADYKGAVAINGDPTQAGAAFARRGPRDRAVRRSRSTTSSPASTSSRTCRRRATCSRWYVTTATIASGETPVVFDWDYLNASHTADNEDWKVVVLDGTGYAGYYNQAINVDAPNPAAARLWQEFLYSDEVQNLWLKGGRASGAHGGHDRGGHDRRRPRGRAPRGSRGDRGADRGSSRPNAGTLLGEKWAAAVQ